MTQGGLRAGRHRVLCYQLVIRTYTLHVSLSNESNISYPFSKLIDFMEGVNKTQKESETRYKSIYANWDASNLISCSVSELSRQLKACNIMKLKQPVTETDELLKTEYKFISSGDHRMALHITTEGVLFYDPNHSMGAQFFTDEESLAEALSVYKTQQKIALVIDDVSYGDENREFDNLIAKYQDIIQTNKKMQSLILSYQKCMLPRRNAAFILIKQISEGRATDIESKKDLTTEETTKLEKLKEDLEYFCMVNPQENIIDESFGNVNTKINSYEQTLLNLISSTFNLELVQQLLKAGADPNMANKNGWTPLMFAAKYGQLEIAQSLLAAGADPNRATKDGRTPLMVAKDNKHKDIVLFIKQQQSVNEIIANSNIDPDNSIAVKISKLFHAYAHPPFLSAHWRSHRLIADTIATRLQEHKDLDGSGCRNFINTILLNNTEQISETGTFKGLMRAVDQLIEKSGQNIDVKSFLIKK